MHDEEHLLRHAAEVIADADALLIAAGAGMGVDSGLPDFRGDRGFWNAYPPYEKFGLRFMQLANPRWFETDPELAWGFYGHRLELYRRTNPHDGFGLLLKWAKRPKHGGFVFTSNVDGHFQRSGFDPLRVYEVHGAIDFMQCTDAGCRSGIYPADAFSVDVDPETMRAKLPLPACPGCGALARPNVLMFGDYGWDEARGEEQRRRFADWLERVGADKLAIIECGAGKAVPTVRHMSERLVDATNAVLVRVNVREPEVPKGQVGLPMGALEGLRRIDALMGG